MIGDMKTLAVISQGRSDYDDRLWQLLESTGIDREEFVGLDYFGLLPFFVIAGASVRTEAHTHDADVHVSEVRVELPEELEEGFYATLPLLLDDAYEE
jgi:hypothetical protein